MHKSKQNASIDTPIQTVETLIYETVTHFYLRRTNFCSTLFSTFYIQNNPIDYLIVQWCLCFVHVSLLIFTICNLYVNSDANRLPHMKNTVLGTLPTLLINNHNKHELNPPKYWISFEVVSGFILIADVPQTSPSNRQRNQQNTADQDGN